MSTFTALHLYSIVTYSMQQEEQERYAGPSESYQHPKIM